MSEPEHDPIDGLCDSYVREWRRAEVLEKKNTELVAELESYHEALMDIGAEVKRLKAALREIAERHPQTSPYITELIGDWRIGDE